MRPRSPGRKHASPDSTGPPTRRLFQATNGGFPQRFDPVSSAHKEHTRFVVWVQRAKMERVMGIEPTWPAWKAGTLPLSYTRLARPGTRKNAVISRAPRTRATSELIIKVALGLSTLGLRRRWPPCPRPAH